MSDYIVDAVVLREPGSLSGDNTGFTSETNEPDNSFSTRTAWYRYTPTVDGTLILETSAGPAPDLSDSAISVFEGGVLQFPGALIDQDDDSGVDLYSYLEVPVEAGQNYLISVHGYDDDYEGSYVLTWDGPLGARLWATQCGESGETGAQSVLYATKNNTSPTDLYTVDTTDGSTTSVGPTGFHIQSLAWDPTTQTMYAVTDPTDPTYPSALITIELASGAGTYVADLGSAWATHAEVASVGDIAFDSAGQLYGIKGGANPAGLFTINKATGAVAHIGSGFTLDGYEAALAFDLDGDLWGFTYDYVYSINKTTGVSTFVGFASIGSRAFDGPWGASVGPDGKMWAVGGGGLDLGSTSVYPPVDFDEVDLTSDLIGLEWVTASAGMQCDAETAAAKACADLSAAAQVCDTVVASASSDDALAAAAMTCD